MWQAVLNEVTLGQLFADLTASAEVLSVQGKAGAGRYGSAEPLTLAAAYDRLASGEITGVQIRYRFEDREWIDTLLRVGHGFRLVRCRVERI
jgi:hypothetical protein